jgi:hypothetical protein
LPRPSDQPKSSYRAQRAPVRDVAQKTAHDLASARLGEFGSKEDFIWLGDGADLLRQETLQLIHQTTGILNARLERDKGADRLSLEPW